MPPSQSAVVAASGRGRRKPPQPKPQQRPRQQAQKKPQQKARKALRQMSYASLPEYVKCVLDPFAMAACGYPDAFNQPTTKSKLVETYTLTPDAAGNCLMQIGPSLLFSASTNAVTANVIQAAVSTQHPDYASLTAQCLWARTVCTGVQIDYIGAPMTASGTLTCTIETKGDYWAGASPASCVDDGESRPALDGRKIALVPTQPSRFEQDTGASYMGPTFPSLYILGTGLTGTTAVFRVTVVRHVEGLPFRNAAMARGNATRTSAQPMAMVALSGIDTDAQSSPSTWSSALSTASAAAWGAVEDSIAPLARSAAMSAVAVGLGAFGL